MDYKAVSRGGGKYDEGRGVPVIGTSYQEEGEWGGQDMLSSLSWPG